MGIKFFAIGILNNYNIQSMRGLELRVGQLSAKFFQRHFNHKNVGISFYI